MNLRGLVLCCLLLPAVTLPAADKLDPAVEQFKSRIDDKTVDRDKLRHDILAFIHSKVGTPAAVQASTLLGQLPSPLDKLEPRQIPELDRFDWQPKELVAVLGEHRGRHGNPVSCVVYSKDGKRVISGGHQGYVRLFDATTLRQQALVGTGHATTCLAISEDSKTLAAGNAYGGLYVWDITKEKPVQTGFFQIGTSTVHGVDISRDGKLLAAGVYDGLIHTFDLDGSKPKERTQLSGHKSAVRAVQFSPDSKHLAGAAADGSIRFWSFQGEKINELGSLAAHTAAISCVCYNARGLSLLAGCDDGTIVRVNIGAKFTRASFFKTPSNVMCIGFSPAGLLTSSHYDGKVRVWSNTTVPMPMPTITLEGHFGPVAGFAYAPDGKMLATGGHDWTVRQWLMTGRPTERFPLKGHWARVNNTHFSPDGTTLACGSEDRTARLWNLTRTAPAQVGQFNKDNTSVYAVAFSPDGKTLASGGNNVIARLWDVAKKTDIRTFGGHPSSVYHLAFTPDGKRLLASSHKHVVLWNPDLGKEVLRFEGHTERINGMSLSPDGRFVLTGTGNYQYKDGKIVTIGGEYQYADCTIRLWDLREGKMRKEVTNLDKPVSALTYAPDGKVFACGQWYRPTSLWDVAADTLKKKAEVKNTSVWSHLHAFSPDGKRLVTLGNDHRLRVTDLATDKVIKDWSLAEYIGHVSFTPDSRYLAVSIQTGPVYILRLDEPPAGVSGK